MHPAADPCAWTLPACSEAAGTAAAAGYSGMLVCADEYARHCRHQAAHQLAVGHWPQSCISPASSSSRLITELCCELAPASHVSTHNLALCFTANSFTATHNSWRELDCLCNTSNCMCRVCLCAAYAGLLQPSHAAAAGLVLCASTACCMRIWRLLSSGSAMVALCKKQVYMTQCCSGRNCNACMRGASTGKAASQVTCCTCVSTDQMHLEACKRESASVDCDADECAAVLQLSVGV